MSAAAQRRRSYGENIYPDEFCRVVLRVLRNSLQLEIVVVLYVWDQDVFPKIEQWNIGELYAGNGTVSLIGMHYAESSMFKM